MAGRVESTRQVQLDHREHEGEVQEVAGSWRGTLSRIQSEGQPLLGAPEPSQAEAVRTEMHNSVDARSVLY